MPKTTKMCHLSPHTKAKKCHHFSPPYPRKIIELTLLWAAFLYPSPLPQQNGSDALQIISSIPGTMRGEQKTPTRNRVCQQQNEWP